MKQFTKSLIKSKISIGISFMIMLMSLSTLTFGQVANSVNYTYSTGSNGNLNLDMNSNAIDLSTEGDLIAAGGIQLIMSVMDMGFDFWFMGTRYFQLSPQVRGVVALGPSTIYATTPLPNLNALSTTAGPTIAPFWNQNTFTVGAGRNIRYKVVGTAPNRCFVLEWRLMTNNSSNYAAASQTFQMRLYETSGTIEYVYGNMGNSENSWVSLSTQAAIGWTNNTNRDSTLACVSSLSTYAQTILSSAVNNAVVNQQTPGAFPGLVAGRYFRWTPVAATAPSSMTFTQVTSSSMNLNWTDNSNNELGFAVYRSDDGGTTYNFITQTAQNVNTFTQTFLIPGKTYHYKVYAVSEGRQSAAASASQATTASGAIASTTSGGLWSAGSTWVGGIVPNITSDVSIADSATVTVDVLTATCNNLTVGAGTSGILRYSAVSPSTLFVNGNVTVAAGGNFNAGTSNLQSHTLIIGGFPANGANGNLTVNGTFDMDFANAPNVGAAVTITFGGFGNGSISGTGATCDFYAIVVNKGNLYLANQNPILDVARVITMDAPVSAGNRLTLLSGTFKLSSASTITPYFGSQTICNNPARLWLNHANASISQVGAATLYGAGSPTVFGELRMDNGAFTYGSGNNTMNFSNASTVINGITTSVGSRLVMNGGTLTVYGALQFVSNYMVHFNMSGGNIIIDPQSANLQAAGTITFSVGAATTVNWSGGTVTLVDPNAAVGGTSVSLSNSGQKIITGGTLQIGDGTSGSPCAVPGFQAGFALTLGHPVWNLVINNRTDLSNTRQCRLSGTSVVKNDVSVNANSTLMMSIGVGSATLQMYGDLINNGNILAAEPGSLSILGTLIFADTTGTQTVSGSGVFTNLATLQVSPLVPNVASSNTVVFSQSNPIVVNTVNLLAGTLTHNEKLSIGRPNQLPTVQLGGQGVAVAAGVFTTAPAFDNTSFPTSYLYATSSTAYTLGSYNEIPSTVSTVYSLTVNNPKGLVIGRNLSVANTLNMTYGNINIGNYNLTLGTGFSNVGTLSYTTGNIINGASGTFTRWFNTTSNPIFQFAQSQFPMGTLSDQRHAWVYFNTSIALTTAGTISARHVNTPGISSMTGITENALTMDTKTNSNWVFSTGNGFVLGTGNTISLNLRGDGAMVGNGLTVANNTITDASGSVLGGTYGAGSGTFIAPQANRTAMSLSNLTSAALYIGSPSANIQGVVTAVASGNWGDAATWNTAAVPIATDNVIIPNDLTIAAAGGTGSYTCANLTMFRNSTLNIAANTLTVNRNFTLSGLTYNTQAFVRLNITGGILNVVGDATLTAGVAGGGLIVPAGFINMSAGTLNVGNASDCNKIFNINSSISAFNYSGGAVNVYGNFTFSGPFNQSAGTMSVYPLGPIGGPYTALASTPGHSVTVASASGVCSGGTIIVVDPPYNRSSAAYSIAGNSGSISMFTGTHTIQMGDGISTAVGPFNACFQIDNFIGGRGPMQNLIINGGSTLYRQTETGLTNGTAYGMYVKGIMTINSGSEFRHVLGNDFYIMGNLLNNGTLTQMASTALFCGLQANIQQSNLTISGSGTFRNDTLSSAITGSFRNLTINLLAANRRAIIDVNNLSVTGALALASGQLDIGSNNFTLGNTVATIPVAGTLTQTGGSMVLASSGIFKRAFGVTGLPTLATSTSLFPLGRLNYINNTVENRSYYVFFSSATALSTGGTIGVNHSNVAGNSAITSFTDGSLTIDTRSNSNWTVTQSNLALASGATILSSAIGENISINAYPTLSNTSLVLATTVAGGTYGAGSGTNLIPQFNRSGLSVTDIANTFYAGIGASNNIGGFVAIANGNWNSGSTWSTGTVPTSSDNVSIPAPYTVLAAGASTLSCNSAILYAGGTLLVNDNTLNIINNLVNGGTILVGGGTVNINLLNTVGNGINNLSGSNFTLNGGTINVGPSGGGMATFLQTATFTINAGTFNLNGNFVHNGSNFIMAGGNFNVDGTTAAGTGSVAAGTHLMNLSGTQTITGGTITIVDPPFAGVSNATLAFNNTAGATWTNNVLRFGNGTSTDGNSSTYGTVSSYIQSSGFGVSSVSANLGNVVVNGNGTNRWTTIHAATIFATSLTINSGSEFRTTQSNASSSALTITGNIINNGTLTLSQGNALTMQGSVPQSITGSGVFRVDTATAILANINNLTISNSSTIGVDMSGIGNITIGGFSTLSGSLSLSSTGNLLIGSTTLTLGTAATSGLTGTINSVSGAIIHTAGGGFKRWFLSTAFPTSVGTAAQFPLGVLVNNTLLRRDIFVYSSIASVTTGGSFTASHTPTVGNSAVTAFTDGSLTGVDNRSNAYWTVTNNGISSSGTFGAQVQGTGVLFPITTSSTTLMNATGILGGTYAAGSNTQTDPRVTRTAMSLTDLTSGLYIGTPTLNYSGNIFTVASGNWSDVNIWSTGVLPTSNDNVTISSNHRINLDLNGATRLLTNNASSILDVNANILTINNNWTLNSPAWTNIAGGTITVVGSAAANGVSNGGIIDLTSGTFNVGNGANYNRTFTSNGTLSVSGGNLNIQGNVIISGTFIQAGGTITVDGNDGIGTTNSVASATALFSTSATTSSNPMTGGSIIIVDPPYTGTGLSFQYGTSTNHTWTTNHTLRFGDGISTTPGSATTQLIGTFNRKLGFAVATSTSATCCGLTLGNVIVNGGSVGSDRFVSCGTSTSQGLNTSNLTVNSGSEIRTHGAASVVGGSLSVAGNLVNNGTVTIDGNTALRMSYYSTTVVTNPQTVSGSGIFRNDIGTSTGNFSQLYINNNSIAGVDMSALGNISVVQSATGLANSTLTIQAGILNLGSNNLTLGENATRPGTLTGTFTSNSNLIYTTGTFTRWFGLSAVSGTMGSFPMGIANTPANFNRTLTLTTSAGPSAGGTVSVQHVNSAGSTAYGTSFTDGVPTITTRSNFNWLVGVANGLTLSASSATLQVQGSGLNMGNITNLPDLRISGLTGIAAGTPSTTNGGTVTDPLVLRSGLDHTNLANTFYVGGNSSNPIDYPSISGNVISAAQIICNGTSAANISVATVSGGTGTYTYLWQSSTTSATAGFGSASGTNNTTSYTVGSPSATIWYRLRVTSGPLTDFSTAIGITVNPVIANNTISADQTLCVGISAATITGSTPTGGDLTYTYLWQSSTTSASAGFGSASGTNTSIDYIPGTPTQTTWYKRIISSGNCTSTSAVTVITVHPLIANNTVSSAQTVCTGSTPSALTGSTPTGGSSSYTYLWESSTTSATAGFASASGTNTTQGYSPSTLTATTWYRRTVNSSVCSDVSTAIQITIQDAIASNTISTDQTMCTGVTPSALTGTTPTGGSGTYTYLWESSTTSASAGFATAAGGSTSASYSVSSLTQTTWFRRSVSSGACSGNVSNAVQITIQTPPTVTTQPSAGGICVGGNSSFIVVASGTSLTYQWQVDAGSGYSNISNGGAYSTATTATLNITGGSMGMNGYLYRCVMTGTCSPTATSNGAALTVNTLPAITTHPSASTICAGNNTTYSVSGTGSSLTYQWQVNVGSGFANISNAGVYSGATSATLAITAATAGMSSNSYRCVVSGACTPSVTSNTATLTINTAPAIGTNPSNVAVCDGGNASYTVAASGTSLTYQWQIDVGSGFGNLSNGGQYANATTATLNITGVNTPMNAYAFRCIVSGTCSPNAISTGGTLTVNTAPAVTTQASASTICAGNNTTFTVVATGGGLTYQWQENQGSGFSNISNAGVYSGATTASLSLTAATAGMNSYSYRCVVSGACTPSTTSNSVALTVNTSPSVSAHPTSTTICAGLNTSYTVVATGTALTYQWQVDDGTGYSNISNTGVYTGATSATLSITAATASMNGYKYRVVSSGTCSPTATSNFATLTINTSPSISTNPNASIICSGDNSSFSVTAAGTAITYQWQENQGSGFANISNAGVYSTATTSTLNITAATAGMNGYSFRCMVSGTCSPVATSTGEALTVKTSPNITAHPQAVGICAGSNVSFTVVATGGGLLYQWQANSGGGGWADVANSSVYSGATAATLNIAAVPLSLDNTNYRCIVSNGCTPNKNTNAAGLSVTLGASISSQPTASTICASSNTSFSVAASGTGLTYQWQVNTGSGYSNISNAGVYSGATSNALSITSATAAMNGYIYRVNILATCGVFTSNTAVLTVNTIPAGTNASPPSRTICDGSNTTFEVTATGAGLVYQWKVWESSTWTNLTNTGVYSGTSTSILNITGATTSLNGKTYRCLLTGTCVDPNGSLSVGNFDVNVQTPLSANTITGTQTICSATSPSTFVGSTPSGGTGTYTYLWENSTTGSGSGYTSASGTNNGKDYSSAALTTGTWFDRIVTSGVCPSITSASIFVTVNPVIASNTITASQTICANTAPTYLSGSTPTGGNVTFTYLWEQSTTSATAGFTSASGANNGQNYSPPSLSATTWYRRVVSAGVCTPNNSTAVAITVNPVFASNTVSSAQTICTGSTPAGLTGSTPTGGSGTYTYQWQSSTTSGSTGFGPAAGINNGVNYTPSAITATAWFRRVVSGGICTADNSASIEITVNTVIASNTIAAAQTICTGTAPTLLSGSIPTGGNGSPSYLWQQSTTSATAGFTSAAGANNGQNYSASTLTQSTWYRRVVSAGACPSDNATAIAITVQTAVANNTISAAQTICSGNIPASLTGSTPTGGSGTYTYLWESSTTSATSGFATASGTSTTQGYSPSALTATTWYRRSVLGGACSADISTAIAVSVNPVIANNSVTGTQTICAASTPTTVTGSTPTGGNGVYTYTWQSSITSATAGFGTATGTNDGINYSPAALTTTTHYRRVVSSGSCVDNATATTVTVDATITGNTIATSQTICSGSSPASLTGSTPSGGTSTYVYQWQQSTSATGTFTAASGTNNTANYTVAALTSTMYYRRFVTSGACSDISSVVTITVQPVIANNTAGSPASVCSGFITSLSGSTPTGGSSAYTYLWQRSTTSASSGFTAAIGINNAQTYTSPAITANAWYRRVINSGSCVDTSSAILITVNALIATNTVTGNQTICGGLTPTTLVGSAPTGGINSYDFIWQSSTTSATAGFSSASGINTNQNYISSSLTATTYFRRVVNSGACTDISSAVTVTVTPAIVNNAVSSAQSICSGKIPTPKIGGTLTGGTGVYIYLWQFSTTAAYSTVTGISNGANYSPTAITTTTNYRRVATSGVCVDTSIAITVDVTPIITTNTVTPTTPICTGGSPSLIGSSPSGAAGVGTYTFLWQKGTSPTANYVTGLGVNSNQNYSAPPITGTSFFRRVVMSGACSDTSIGVVQGAFPALGANNYSGTQAICSGNTAILPGSNGSGGNGQYVYLWQSSTTDIASGYTNAAGTNNTASYTTQALTVTTYFRRVITSGNAKCIDSGTYAPVTVSITPVIVGNSIGSAQTICSGTSAATLTGAATTGGIGTYTIVWVSSTTDASNGFTAASGANNGANYSPGVLTATAWFKRVVMSGTCKDSSAAVQITVNDVIADNTISSTQTICTGSTPDSLTGTSVTGGSGTYTYLWESSTTSATAGYASASGTNTNQNYTPSTLTATTWYRRTVSGGICSSNTSATVVINVNVPIAGNTVSAAQSICANTLPAPLTGTTPTGGNGSYAYTWQSSTNGTTFTAASGANNGQNYNPTILTVTTWFRRVVSAGVCGDDNSVSVKVTVNDPIVGNTIGTSQTICTSTIPSALTGASPSGGAAFKINEDFNGGSVPSTWSIVNASSLLYGISTINSYGRAGTAGALYADNYNVSSASATVTSAAFSTSSSGDSMRFDVAAASYPGYVDSLTVWAGNGTNFTRIAAWQTSSTVDINSGGITTVAAMTGGFVPSSTQWGTKAIALPTGTTQIRFNFISGFGNNIYIDKATVDNIPFVYTWQSSTTSATAGYAAASGTNNGRNYAPSTLTASTWYRRVAASGVCPADTSASISITVNPVIANNTIGTAQTICTGSNPATLTGSAATGGNGTYSFTWLSSTTSATAGFTAASGANTATNYNSGALSATTWFKRVVSAGVCSNDTSATVQITVNPAIASNSISASQTICSGTAPAGLTGTAASGGSGTYTYLWESSTTSATAGYASASGTNNTQNYTAGTLTATSWYRRSVTSGICGTNTSTSIEVTVNPVIANNTIGTAQTICAGTSAAMLTGASATGGSGSPVYLWESSTTSATAGFAAASGVNNAQNYNTGTLSVTTWYRRTVSAGVCTSNTSTTVQITVNPVIASNSISASQIICSGTAANALTGSNPSGGNSSYTYQWQSSTVSASSGFNDASGSSSSAGYSTGNLTNTTWYRRVVSAGVCTSDISNVIEVTVNPGIANNSIGSNQTICITSTPSALVGSAPSGGASVYSYLWLMSTTSASSGFTAANSPNNGQHYFSGNLTQTTWFKRTVSSGVCTDNTSNVISITVDLLIANNTVTADQTICTGTAPTTLAGSTTTGGSGVFTNLWQVSTTSSTTGYTSASGSNTGSDYSPSALTETSWFRRVVSSGVCATSNSDVVKITVSSVIANNSATADQTICTGMTPEKLTGSTPTGGSGTYNFAWESSTTDATSGFSAASGTAGNSDYSPSALTATTWYRRVVSSGGCSSTITAIKITVNPVIADNNAGADLTKCFNTSAMINGSAPSGGDGTAYAYLWQNADTSGVYSNAPDSNSLEDYTTINLNQNTWYKRLVRSGGCADTSAAILVSMSARNTWTGDTSDNWAIMYNWACGRIPMLTDSVEINSGTPFQPHIYSPGAIANTLQLNALASLIMDQDTSDLTLMGDLLRDTSSIMTNTKGTIHFVSLGGSTSQQMAFGDYNNVEIDNFNGVNLDGTNSSRLTTINGYLSFHAGKLFLKDNSLKIAANATILSVDNQKYIVTNGAGSMIKASLGTGGSTTAFVFPIGSNKTSFTPATVSNKGKLNDISAKVMDEVYLHYTGQTPIGTPFTDRVVNKTWFIAPSNSDSSVNVDLTLQWNADDELSNFARLSSHISHYVDYWHDDQSDFFASGNNPYRLSISGLKSLTPYAVRTGKTSGVEEINSYGNHELITSVRPNPFTVGFAITFNVAEKSDVRIVMTDISGKIINQSNIKADKGLNDYLFADLMDLNDGVYFVSIVTSNKVLTHKVMKHH